MEKKRCSTCKEELDIVLFGTNSAKKDGYQTTCKVCKKRVQDAWYAKNSTVHKANVNVRNVKQRMILRQHVIDYLLHNPCIDCNEADVYVLDFDHRSDKNYNIAEMIGSAYSLAKLEKEIAKCDVRCANCHRRKTGREQNWYQGIRLTLL